MVNGTLGSWGVTHCFWGLFLFVCWTENVHVNLLELDGMDCVENDMLMHVI